jgi:hypothetical protein
MPPYRKHFEYAEQIPPWHGTSFGLASFNEDEILYLTGRIAGACRIIKLFSAGPLPRNLTEIVNACGNNRLNAVAYYIAINNNRASRQKIVPQKKILAQALALNDTECDEFKQLEQEFDSPLRLFLCSSNIYLADLFTQNRIYSIIVASAEDLQPGEKVFALDLMQSELTEDRHAIKTLLIIRMSEHANIPIHKVGVSYPTTIHDSPSVEWKDCECTGIEVDKFLVDIKIGGRNCGHCSSHRSDETSGCNAPD